MKCQMTSELSIKFHVFSKHRAGFEEKAAFLQLKIPRSKKDLDERRLKR